MRLAYDRQGSGPPLVLLHGFGMHRRAWDHLIGELARDHDVITVDWPGAGESPAIPDAAAATAPSLAAMIAAFLRDELGLDRPHVAGVSAGGWLALELGRLDAVASVTAISPGGLWRKQMPRFVRGSLAFIRTFCRVADPALGVIFATAPGRMLMLQLIGRPWQMSPAEAIDTARAMGRYPSWRRVLRDTAPTRFTGGADITVPVTVALAPRDLLMLRVQSQHREELPHAARVIDLPGCGHVPLWDAPDLIVDTIRGGVAGSEHPNRIPESPVRR